MIYAELLAAYLTPTPHRRLAHDPDRLADVLALRPWAVDVSVAAQVRLATLENC